ncbi:hypothetical protein C3L33_22460, partial [Rhododendron williamsianum]
MSKYCSGEHDEELEFLCRKSTAASLQNSNHLGVLPVTKLSRVKMSDGIDDATERGRRRNEGHPLRIQTNFQSPATSVNQVFAQRMQLFRIDNGNTSVQFLMGMESWLIPIVNDDFYNPFSQNF